MKVRDACTFRLLPYRDTVRADETDRTTKTITMAAFPTKAEAREAVFDRADGIARVEEAVLRDKLVHARLAAPLSAY